MKPWMAFGIALALVANSGRAQNPPSPPAGRPAPAAAADAGERALRDRLDVYAKAYNAHNAAGVADLFTDDATLVDLDGGTVRGKEAIGAQFAAGFAESSSYTLEPTIDSIRFLTPDVAQVEGLAKFTAANASPTQNRFVLLAVRKDQAWKIAEIRDLPVAAEDIPPADRLKELEWMVGEWVDQRGDLEIHSTFEWGENKAYLTRRTTANSGGEKAQSSLMIVAWDPKGGQIHSWMFDSDGSRTEGIWTRASDSQWIIRAEGVSSDGSPSSATQIVTIVGKDAVKTSSVDRIIDDQVAQDTDEVLMVRKPPAAGGAAPPRPAGR
jgi:uncharacterized protein (TIGR02246 family)